MKRKLLLVLVFIALPGFANALGLGKLQLNSALNQPFDARIELVSASAAELDSLNIGLADIQTFRRARIDRPFVLGKLRFVVKENENGPDYIQISSRDAIREPFLNFLLEAAWSTGRLYREYTVLLDPPLYDPHAKRSASSESYTSSSSSSDSYVTDEAEVETMTSVAPDISYGGNEYGPTDSSDTLWSIASRVRPDSSVSVQQMMLALLRANPGAFLNGNINGLKRGQILEIPVAGEMDALSLQDAIAEVRSQNGSWQDAQGMTVTDRGQSTSTVEDSSAFDASSESSAMIEDDVSELRLVAASSDGAGIGQSGGQSGSDSDVNLALANEQIEAVSQENAELKDRMQQAETIIEDLKRLISLKDDELAALQQQMAAGGAVIEEAEETEVILDTEEYVLEEEVVEDDDMAAEVEEDFVIEQDEEADEVVAEDLIEEEVEEEFEEETAVEEEFLAPVPVPQGLVDQALGFIMGNLIIIAGTLGGLIIVIVSLLFISRRKQNVVSESVPVAATEFPDFEESEVEPDLSEAGVETSDVGVDASEDKTVIPDGESEVDEDKTAFVAPPDPQQEVAAAPEPEEPEEDPLAEVNVFLAYEHFDQAEEFVREAMAGTPDNLDFHAKLLEVFYAANDKKSYEEAAQVLHDKVNGEGAHWDMAQAMWQEMSPNRALFEEGEDEPTDVAEADSSGGIMDITAEDESESADASVDFDLGMDAGDATAAADAEKEDILDLTADGEDQSVLDVTAAISIDDSSSDEDLLDVTAAVGLETEDSVEQDVVVADDEPMLDITGGGEASAEDDDVLDISHVGGEGLLDVTANANLEADDLEEDLLDVTSSVGAEADGEELLEVPAEDAGEDDNALDFDIGGMDVEAEDAIEETGDNDNAVDFDIGGMDIEPDAATDDEAVVEIAAAGDDNTVDLDIGGVDIEAQTGTGETEAGDDNIIDFDTGGADAEDDAGIELDLESADAKDDGGIELDLESADAEDDGGIELDLDSADAEDDGGIELDLDSADAEDDSGVELDLSIGDGIEASDGIDEASGDSNEISIDDLEDSSDGGLEIDLSIDDSDSSDDLTMDADSGTSDDAPEIELTLDEDNDGELSDADLEMDFDLEIQDDSADVSEIDMEGTVEMPKLDMDEMGIEIDDDDDDDDDDEDDRTVFVPRAGATDEQSDEDEIATKLDLAKAYVELGDKDSARGILDEVLADGNDEQKQTAQDLIKQLD